MARRQHAQLLALLAVPEHGLARLAQDNGLDIVAAGAGQHSYCKRGARRQLNPGAAALDNNGVLRRVHVQPARGHFAAISPARPETKVTRGAGARPAGCRSNRLMNRASSAMTRR